MSKLNKGEANFIGLLANTLREIQDEIPDIEAVVRFIKYKRQAEICQFVNCTNWRKKLEYALKKYPISSKNIINIYKDINVIFYLMDKEIHRAFAFIDKRGDGLIKKPDFIEWELLTRLVNELAADVYQLDALENVKFSNEDFM